MKNRDYRDYLRDILTSVSDIENFVDNLTYDQFVNDRKTLNAVVRSIEIIGEASKNIPETIKTRYPELPWKQMAGMRDKLIHAYFGADSETIYKAAKTNIPQLKKPIQKILIEQEKQ
ncbi:MAG TPA: DUF86 domain-containing protein [Candidatus Deferrimicrobiaceae bacterium]|jgi:uncharacterized protein with HEPN domain|nr:DUF86 domain-containing protein [Candidatus Deferrimicrobiaceae bacterium]